MMQRILLLKFLCDEVLSSSLIHQHLEQCTEAIMEMQQKLRSLSSEWKNTKMRQEFLTAKLAKVEPSILKEVGVLQNSSHVADHMRCDQRPQEGVGDGVTPDVETSATAFLNKNQGKAPLETDAQPGELHVNSCETKISSPEKIISPGRHESPIADTSHVTDNLSCEKDTLHKSIGRNHETHSLKSNAVELQTAHDASLQASQELQACQQDLNAARNELQNLQQLIRSIESQLLKQSIRRDFLGNDLSGRFYWGCCFPDENPRILVDGSISLQKPVQADLKGSKVPSPLLRSVDHGRLMLSPWTYYETETEISELVQWLHDDDPKVRDLRESILCWKRLRFGDVQKERKQAQNPCSQILARGLVTNAAISMEKRYGPCIKSETKTLKKGGGGEEDKVCRARKIV